jgi:hypothetical protein
MRRVVRYKKFNFLFALDLLSLCQNWLLAELPE